MPDNKPPNSPEKPAKTGIVQTDKKARSAKKSIGKKSIREIPPSGQSLERSKNPELTAGKPPFISQNKKTVPEKATPISEAMRGSSIKTIDQAQKASGRSEERSNNAELVAAQSPQTSQNLKTAEVAKTTPVSEAMRDSVMKTIDQREKTSGQSEENAKSAELAKGQSSSHVRQNVTQAQVSKTTTQVSEAMRGLSVKTIDQAEKAFDMFFDAASRSLASIPSPRMEISKQALSFTEQNVKAVFDHARKLAQATDLKQVMQIQSDFLKNQFTNTGRHMQQMFGETAPSTKDGTKE